MPNESVPVSVVALSITAVSCAKGKLFNKPPPPELDAHAVEFQVVSVPTRYTVLDAGNVIPLLPPQFPARRGEIGAATPAMVMSRKSQLFADT